MHAGFQDEHPEDCAQQHDRRNPVGAGAVQPEKPGQRQEREQKIVDVKLGRVEERDDEDGAEVVEDGERQKEYLQRRGRTLAE